MFKKLTDFGYQRTGKEAFGFYVAYFALVVLLGGVLGGLFGALIPDIAYENGFRLGTVLSVGITVGLCYLIINQKKIIKDFSVILLMVASGVVALFAGALLGLLIPAYLTTKKERIKGKAARVKGKERR